MAKAKKAKTNESGISTFFVEGTLVTSNKLTKYSDPSEEKNRKQVYISLTPESVDKVNAMSDDGFRVYTPETPDENGAINEFTVCKCAEKVRVFASNEKEEKPKIFDGSVNTPNFQAKKVVKLAIIKGYSEEWDKHFFRLSAIKVESLEDVEELEPSNPFAE